MKTYTAREIADILNAEGDEEATLRMVRYYTQMGFVPELEFVGKERVYTDTHLNRFRAIRTLKKTGEKLDSIQVKLRAMPEADIANLAGRMSYYTSANVIENDVRVVSEDVTVTFSPKIEEDMKSKIVSEISKILKGESQC